jgi:acetyl-CoA carboxylase biotin carboxyl carrier protein
MFDMEKLKSLIALLETSTLKKLHVKEGDYEVTLEKPDFLEPYPTIIAPKHAHTAEAPKEEKKGEYIVSPMVGTFYATPSPGHPTFVKVGDKVTEDTVVCIVEAMKVMNEVKARKAGTIVEVLVDNAQPVEFGSKLFRIEK